MDIFTWHPLRERKLTHTALNRRIEMENGNEQVARVSVNPKVIWELNFSGLYSEMLQIKSFFDAHAPGGVKFTWVDEDSTVQTVRFATDSCEIQQKFELTSSGQLCAAYTTTLQFRKVYS